MIFNAYLGFPDGLRVKRKPKPGLIGLGCPCPCVDIATLFVHTFFPHKTSYQLVFEYKWNMWTESYDLEFHISRIFKNHNFFNHIIIITLKMMSCHLRGPYPASFKINKTHTFRTQIRPSSKSDNSHSIAPWRRGLHPRHRPQYQELSSTSYQLTVQEFKVNNKDKQERQARQMKGIQWKAKSFIGYRWWRFGEEIRGEAKAPWSLTALPVNFFNKRPTSMLSATLSDIRRSSLTFREYW